jgi:signal transduction histidine kinase
MSRRWGLGLTGHVAIILVAVVVFIVAIGSVIFIRERGETIKRFVIAGIADRIVSVVDLVENSPAEERRAALRIMRGRQFKVRRMRRAPAIRKIENQNVQEFEELLRGNLGALGDRPIRIGFLERSAAKHVLEPRRGTEHRMWKPHDRKDFRRIAIAIGDVGGEWLVFQAPIRAFPPPWERRLIFIIVGSAVIVLIFALWAAHLVTRPLKRFAEAADRFGVDVGAPPLPEHGSRELRKATHAFNRMQDRLRRLVSDRTLMLAALSHDLRTMLTRLKLRTDFIEDEPQRQKALADIDEMQAMLDVTLSFARDETTEEARTSVDLSSLLESLCDDLRDSGQQVDYESGDRITARCQPVAIRRMFSNLIGNAVKYGDEAHVTALRDGSNVVITVADRGPGIPPEMWEQVFTPFFRLEGSRSRETGGTGLGLSVARSIVRRHGGDIALSNRSEGGLVVTVTLPDRKEDAG